MKLNYLLPLFLILLFSCQREEFPDNIKDSDEDNFYLAPGTYLDGMIRIKFTEIPDGFKIEPSSRGGLESGINALDEASLKIGAYHAKRTFRHGGKYEKRMRKADLHLWYDIYFDEGVSLPKALGEFSKISELSVVEAVDIASIDQSIAPGDMARTVLAALQDYSRNESFPFNDPMFVNQWHYNNRGDAPSWIAGADANIFEAWKVNTGSPEVIVAIMDTGVEWYHPDLAANMWINYAELNGTTGVDDDGNGYVDDIYGYNFTDKKGEIEPGSHGTHVAGTVAAVNNNGIGVAGVAGGSGNNDGVKLMSCQIFPPTASGSVDYDCFVYAANNGAVISCNSWSTSSSSLSSARRAAIDYFLDYAGTDEEGEIQVGPIKGGVVIFAASNSSEPQSRFPGRYERVLSVVSIGPNFEKVPHSNYGTGCDLSAPGGNTEFMGRAAGVYSTDLNGTYSYKQGTSMACPHVVGIAALIVSEYGVGKKGLTRDAVNEMLLSSTHDIDSYNPSYAGKMGVGLIDGGLALNAFPGMRPDNIGTVATKTSHNRIGLSWTVTGDATSKPLDTYHLVISTSELSDIDIDNLPENVKYYTLNNRLSIGSTQSYIFDGLSTGTTYYVAVIGADTYGNLTDPVMHTLSTGVNHPPVVSTAISNIYFGGKGTNYTSTINIMDHITDQNGELETFTVVASASNENVFVEVIDNGTLRIVPRAYGSSQVNVTVTDSGGASVQTSFLTMSRDNSQLVDLYPNPVSDILNIRMGLDVNGTVQVTLYNGSGQKVMSGDIQMNPYQPGTIDLSKISSGNYTIGIKYGAYDLKRSITKK